MNEQEVSIEVDRAYERWLVDTNLEDMSPKASFLAGMRAGIMIATTLVFKKEDADG